MIDNLSGGRLIAGFVVGGGPEYYSFPSTRPTPASASPRPTTSSSRRGPSRARTSSSASTTGCASSTPGPSRCSSRTPRSGSPASGSLETMRVRGPAALRLHGHPVLPHLGLRPHVPDVPRGVRDGGLHLRPRARRAGCVPIYVAETDEEARRQYEEHFWYFVKRLLPGITINPPGYTSLRSLEGIMKGMGTFALLARDVGRGHRGRVRHRRLTRDRVRAAGGEPRPPRHRQPARALPARHAARRPHPPQPRAVRRRGHAPAAGAVPRRRADCDWTAPSRAERPRDDDGRRHHGPSTTASARSSSSGAARVDAWSTSTRPTGEGPGLELLDVAGRAVRRDRADVPRLRRVRGHRPDRRHGGRRLPPPRPVGRARPRPPDRGRPLARRLDGGRAGHPLPGAAVGAWCWSTRSASTSRAPIGDIFGRSPAEMADDLFADRDHPMAQMAAASRATGTTRPARRDDVRDDPADGAAPGRDGPARLEPVPPQPAAAPPAGADHGADAGGGGRRRPAGPQAHAEAYAAGIPGARLVVVPGAHLLTVEQPAELVDLIAGFAAGLPPL